MVLLAPGAAFGAESFTESEERLIRRILKRIAPIETADRISCSWSKAPLPHKNPVIFCEVQYTDPSRWLAKFRTKMIGGQEVYDLLLNRGKCGYVDGWTRPRTMPYRCELSQVSCNDQGCSAH